MTPAPVSWPTTLFDLKANPPASIPATATRGLSPDDLVRAETLWGPRRTELVEWLGEKGITLENGHWNWHQKVGRVSRGELIAFGIECESQVQGLMATPVRPRWSLLTPGKSVIYVDYLESAPWNHPRASSGQRFAGVGTVLIGEAIRFSMEQGQDGRLGLHSLPQAEQFYVNRCGMRRLGPDPAYYDLEYFEYAEGEAAAWLARSG